MNEKQARAEICRVGRSLFARGYVHSTAGNISVRVDSQSGGGFLITPTDSCLGFLEPSQLARIDGDGNQIGGSRASKTLALHRRIYDATETTDAPAGCILHTHSTNCVALTVRQPQRYYPGPGGDPELLPPLTPYFVMKVGHVPVIVYGVPGAKVVADRVVSTIVRYRERAIPVRAVMLERLGPTVWNDAPATAMATLEELEEAARLACTCRDDQTALGEAEIQELRDAFGARW